MRFLQHQIAFGKLHVLVLLIHACLACRYTSQELKTKARAPKQVDFPEFRLYDKFYREYPEVLYLPYLPLLFLLLLGFPVLCATPK